MRWVWAVAYRKKQGALRWFFSDTQNLDEASNPTQRALYEKLGYREYGVSRVLLRIWKGYREIITREEYERAQRHQSKQQKG